MAKRRPEISREALRETLLKAFARIEDPDVQRKVIALARMLTANCEPDRKTEKRHPPVH